jgi:hypothetical protein
MLERPNATSAAPVVNMNLILNWFEELRARVP